jgi:hypothetical protein
MRRRRLVPPFAVVTSLALFAVVAHALALRCGRADAWRLARELLAEARRGEALAAREAASRRYIAAKRAVADEVIAGRLSLAEAAERFARLNGLLDGDGAGLAPYKCPVGEQALCANVIVWVSATLPRGSSQRASVQARLEAEYRERFGAAPPPRRVGRLPRLSPGMANRAMPPATAPSEAGIRRQPATFGRDRRAVTPSAFPSCPPRGDEPAPSPACPPAPAGAGQGPGESPSHLAARPPGRHQLRGARPAAVAPARRGEEPPQGGERQSRAWRSADGG